MKIGIDIKAAFEEKRSGIGNYVYHLVKNLLAVDKKNEYYLYSPKEEINFLKSENAVTVNRKNPLSLLRKLDVFHGPDFKLMPVKAKKKIVTIHDAASFNEEDYMSSDFKKLTQNKIIKSIKDSDLIITISQSVKDELIKYCNLNDDNIKVVYHGINEELGLLPERINKEEVLQKYDIKIPYFLFVGNLETRKNISTLIKAFNIFTNNYDSKHQLVLIGKAGYGYEKIKEELNASPQKKDIKELGWVDDSELSIIYSSAEIFVFPTLYEGFGFPVLEAMKFKLPVIASDLPVMKEIAGDAAAFVNPFSPEEISKTMYNISSDATRKNKFINLGLERNKLFTWQKTAEKMISIYES